MKQVLSFTFLFFLSISAAMLFFSDREGILEIEHKERLTGSLKLKAVPRIAIAGIGTESSTFSPALAGVEAFRVRQGDDIFQS